MKKQEFDWGRRDWGRGAGEVNFPEVATRRFNDFAGGYDSRDRRQDTPPNFSPNSIDMEVDEKDRLVKAPGITQSEQFLNRSVSAMALHASIDFRSELLLFAPPFLGVKETGNVVWTDHGLDNGEFHWTNFGGEFLFTDGEKVWIRAARSSVLEEVPEAPVARSYASIAARVFAAAPTIDGTREPMVIAWTAANANARDWTGEGSGFEPLISDMSAGDRIVAIRAIGLDFLAILMRRSIWIGRRTGQLARPVDFQPRVGGMGTVNEATVQVTPMGAVFLSDDGVRAFDGNQAPVISEQINNDLLPLDYANLDSYSASYNPQLLRYYLYTPEYTFVYDMRRQRWYRRSSLVKRASIFAPQVPTITWADLLGQTWASLADQSWESFGGEEGQEVRTWSILADAGGDRLGYEDPAVMSNFGVAFVPEWEAQLTEGPEPDSLVTTKQLFVEYVGFGQISLWLPNLNSDYEQVITQTLNNKTDPRVVPMPLVRSGRGFGFRIQILTGDPKISMVAMQVMPRGPSTESVEFGVREYYNEFL